MARTVLEVVVAGDSKSLERAMSRSSKATDKFGKDAEKSTKRASSGIRGIGTAAKVAGGALAGGALVAGLRDVANAAIESEKSTVRLKAQLRASGLSYKQYGDRIEEVIQKQSRLAALDDEDLQDAFTNIVRTTGNVEKSLRLVGIASDLARAKQMDVAKAGEIVAKVAGGNTGVLSRYGIQIEKGATATEALGTLQRKFAGQAEAYGKSNAGAFDRFSVASENLKEKLGAALLPTLSRVAESAGRFISQIESGTGAGGRFAATIGQIASAVGQFVSTTVQIAQTTAGFAALGAAVGALAGRFAGLAIAAVITQIGQMAGAARAAGGAFAALSLAVKANPIGLLATAVGAVVGGLLAFAGANRDAKVSADDLTSALERQMDAARRLKDLDIEAAQRKANVKTANAQLAAAERELAAARASGDPARVKQAEAALAQAKVSVTRANRELKRSEEDATKVKRDAKVATDEAAKSAKGRISTLTSERSKTRELKDVIRDQIRAARDAGATREQLAPLQKQYSRLADSERKQTREINSELKRLPKEVRTRVVVKFSLSGVSGFLNDVGKIGSEGFSDAGDIPAAMTGATKRVMGMAGAAFKKSPAARFGSGGSSSSGGLLGGLSDEARGVYARVARLFGGVKITSGRRSPAENARVGGAKNSDHLSGNAIDLVPSEGWNARSVARFDRIAAWARRMGLWVGWRGLKNHGPGNHLHLSYRGHAGGGKDAGDLSIADMKGLAQSVGLNEERSSIAAAVGWGESSGKPNISNRNDNGTIDRGLWQINSVHGALSTFDVQGNARAMARISKGGRNFQPWAAYSGPDFRGSDGPWRQFYAAAKRAKPGGGRGGSGSSRSSSGASSKVKGVKVQQGSGSAGGAFLSGLVNAQKIQEGSSFTAGPAKPLVGPGGAPVISPDIGGPTGVSVAQFLKDQKYGRANADVALAGLTEDTADDLAALSALQGLVSGDLEAAKGRGDFGAIVDLAGQLKGLNDQIKSLKESTDANTAAIEAARADSERVLKEQALRDARLSQSQYGVLAKAIADVANGTLGGRVGLGFQSVGWAGGGARY